MAGSKTAYLSRKLLDHPLGGDPFVPPTTLYVCLSLAAYDANATGDALNEVPADDYHRLSIPNNSATWSPASTGNVPVEKHNLADFSFPVATSQWDTPQSAYLADAQTGGNLLYGADISNPQLIDLGDTAKIGAGAFVFYED